MVVKGEGEEKKAWVVSDIGGRASFEDAHCLSLNFGGNPAEIFGAVLDGHDGKEVAELAARRLPEVVGWKLDSRLTPERALKEAFLAIDAETAGLDSGSVAVAFLLSGRELTFANVGDSALLLVSEKTEKLLTEWHRVSNEKERARVIEAGGWIDGSYVMIPRGGLQCTRSLGDHAFKGFGVIADPFVGRIRLGAEDLWLIAACDGLWDVMEPEEASTIARKMATPRAVAEALYHAAVVERETPDNLTVLAVAVGKA